MERPKRMSAETLPKCSLDKSETGCCPRFDPAPWDGQEFALRERLFVRATTINFLHIPLNIGAVFTRTWSKIQQAGAAPTNDYLLLSTLR
jgi:hypothetical protein